MNIFGIGFPELLFIFVIALIVLGPRIWFNFQQLSSAIRKFVSSNTWKSIVHSTKEIRDIQGKIIEDTGLQDSLNTLQEQYPGTRQSVHCKMESWCEYSPENRRETSSKGFR